MIEAIPLNSECIVLVITKVEDPEELDTRFAKFAPSATDDEDEEYDDTLSGVLQSISDGADDVLDLFRKIHDGSIAETIANTMDTLSDLGKQAGRRSGKNKEGSTAKAIEGIDLTRIYAFDSLNQVTRLAHVLDGHYEGRNSLYKNEKQSNYVLVVAQSKHTPEEFNKICNMLSEYGSPEKFAAASEAYMEEHFDVVIKDNAVQVLAKI